MESTRNEEMDKEMVKHFIYQMGVKTVPPHLCIL